MGAGRWQSAVAFAGETAVAVGDGAADGGRLGAFGVAKAAADAEAAVFVFAGDGAEATAVFTFAGVVGDDGTFGVRRAFDFEQIRTAPATIGLVRLTQHQAFAALTFNGVQRTGDVFAILHRGLRDDADARLRVRAQPVFEGGETLVEVAARLRHVEDVQIDAAPVATGSAHRSGDGFKLSPPAVEFAVQRPRRVVGKEGGGRAKGIAGAADELLSVPVSAHAVEFFAHCPAADVLTAPVFGEDEVRGGKGNANEGKSKQK